ncbi:MAG: tRNA lysidine(34) synthetase TilS [Gammaproteobacteria bacterium]|nr:tRNA lysidine(34) synthetase TilS [Gammaproteobacteria bacterium]
MDTPKGVAHANIKSSFEKQLEETLKRFAPNQRFLLGCSGGLDSVVLLFALYRILAESGRESQLRVIHVDHDLQAPSAAWAKQVVAQCEALSVDVIVKKVKVAAGNMENEARNARYAAFRDVIAPDEVLVLAHHQQDQAETVLMRLLNGSGVSGLAAMRVMQTQDELTIFRPLLNTSRAEIHQFAVNHDLQWVDDPANEDLSFDRVVMRQKVWPVLAEHWQGFEAAIVRTASLMVDAESVLVVQGETDLAAVVSVDGSLNIEKVLALPEARVRWLLARWMQGEQHYAPPLSRVDAVRQMMEARIDATPQVIWQVEHCNLQFRRYQGQLYRLPLDLPKATTQTCQFSMMQTLNLATGNWRVESIEEGLPLSLLDETLRLRPRREGELLHLKGRVGHWPLKKILQSLQLPQWQREQVQILETLDGQPLALLSAAGFWLTAQAVESNSKSSGWGLVRV